LLKCALLASVCVAAYAVETKWWKQSGDDFEKGSLTHLSLSSDGKLTLAPTVKEAFDASVAFLWSVARDSKGNIYAGGGGLGSSKSKLFMVDPQGKAKALAELDGIAIQAIAVDRSDRVYAATSPDGKVYRVDQAGKAEVFYDPKSKYIWALAFDRTGNLYVATGDQGEIHRVTPTGAGSVFFRTEEAHARSLAVDSRGNLIVGTDPSGLILRVSPAGEGFVLYEAPKREITAVAVAADGAIYAAGIGNKQAGPTPSAAVPPAPQAAAPPAGQAAPAPITMTTAPRPGGAPVPASASQNVAGGSEVYLIQADGYARKIWSHPQEFAYAIAFDASGKPIVGTGNHGYLYRLDSDHSYTRLAELASTQVTGLSSAPDGTLYAVTGNIGKVFSIGPGFESSGMFESDVFDAGAFSYWGRLTVEPEGQSGLTIETRSGNLNRPLQNWSPWQKLNGGRVASPAARFIQYRLTFGGKASTDEVDLAYQMKNVPPAIEKIEITPANYKFPAPLTSGGELANPPPLTLAPLGRKAPVSGPAVANAGATPALTWAKGHVGVRWLASDDNGDTLQYKIEIRGVNETEWKPLRDGIREHYFSWDSTAFPDGKYVVRVTASDAPSNPPGQALQSSRETDPFLIDNTPPEISCCVVTGSTVQFRAKDALSVLGTAEYSINGGEWMVVEPTTRLSDSKEGEYRIALPRLQGETTVAVRIQDDYDNQAVAKTVVNPGAKP
jgi:sugar lactone lactonase YvrE